MLTRSEILNRVNKSIYNAKGKIGGDSELQDIANQSIRKLQRKTVFPSTKRKSAPFMVFSNVFYYALPDDIAYDKMAELVFEEEEYDIVKSQFEKTYPKFLFSSRNPFQRRSNIDLDDENKDYNDNLYLDNVEVIAIEFENGKPYLKMRISEDLNVVKLHNFDTIADNGTWSLGGDGTSLAVDNKRYKEGSASLGFNSGGASTDITLTNSTMTAIDLDDYKNKGNMFFWLKIPATAPSYVTIKWGNDSSNYYSKTVTKRQDGLDFVEGWNLLGFDWLNATETGTVDNENIDYVEITISNSVAVAQNGYRIDYLFFAEGKECSMNYYSNYWVKDNDGTRKKEFDSVDDEIILAEEEVDILIDQCSEIALRQLREDKNADMKKMLIEEAIQDIEDNYPSSEEVSSITYYNI